MNRTQRLSLTASLIACIGNIFFSGTLLFAEELLEESPILYESEAMDTVLQSAAAPDRESPEALKSSSPSVPPAGTASPKIEVTPLTPNPLVTSISSPLPSSSPFPSPSPLASGKPLTTNVAKKARLPVVIFVPGNKISEIQWSKEKLKLEPEGYGSDVRIKTFIEGVYKKPNYRLFKIKSLVKRANTGVFKEEVFLDQPVTVVEWIAIGKKGQVERETLRIEFPDIELYKRFYKSKRVKRFSFAFGLGFTRIYYDEVRAPSFSEWGITAKAAANFLFWAPYMDVGVSAFITAVPFGPSQVADDHSTVARFLGINGRVGFYFPFIKEPWRVGIMAGIYYTTMFVTPQDFGFQNMMGPQFFPTVRRAFSNGSALSAYFKFSPVSDGAGFLSLDSREIAGGAAYSIPFFAKTALSFSLDVANIAVVISSIPISSTSISLGVGIGF